MTAHMTRKVLSLDPQEQADRQLPERADYAV